MSLKKIKTYFRAYQLGNPGSSYSYYYQNHFTLVEARYNDVNKSRIRSELSACGKEKIDCLHITSWDLDHCRPNELEQLLADLHPSKIEVPGYAPSTDSAKDADKIIQSYRKKLESSRSITIQKIDPPYIKGLKDADDYGYSNVYYWPKDIHESNHNNNSSVALFRTGCFNVLSTGDVEDHMIGRKFMGSILKNELDVLILPHHGSENGFANQRFLKETAPLVAICNSNYDNQFEHPSQNVKDWLYKLEIPIFTTKTGDVLIRSKDPHLSIFEVINLKADSEEVSSRKEFHSKKKNLLTVNKDTLKDRIKSGGFNWPK